MIDDKTKAVCQTATLPIKVATQQIQACNSGELQYKCAMLYPLPLAWKEVEYSPADPMTLISNKWV